MVHIFSPTVEDNRHRYHELADLKAQHTQHSNRIKAYLATQGTCLAVRADFPKRLKQQHLWNGDPLPAGLQACLLREYQCFQLAQEQIKVLEIERKDAIRNSSQPEVEQVCQLLRLRGIGENSVWLFVMEFFAWRAFRNRREVDALAGLTPPITKAAMTRANLESAKLATGTSAPWPSKSPVSGCASSLTVNSAAGTRPFGRTVQHAPSLEA